MEFFNRNGGNNSKNYVTVVVKTDHYAQSVQYEPKVLLRSQSSDLQ